VKVINIEESTSLKRADSKESEESDSLLGQTARGEGTQEFSYAAHSSKRCLPRGQRRDTLFADSKSFLNTVDNFVACESLHLQ
jgi:hypothetical protein